MKHIVSKLLFIIFLLLTINHQLSTNAQAALIDNMDTLASWTSQTGDGSTVTVSTTTGKINKALKLDYNYGASAWVQVYENLQYIDLSANPAVRFKYRGDGSPEELVIKFKDADGDTFQYSLGNVSNASAWTTATIKLADFTCETAHSTGDKVMDWAKVQSLEFVINDTGDTGGSGTVEIDQVERLDNVPAVFFTFQDMESSNGTPIATKTTFHSIQDFESGNGTTGNFFWSIWNSTNTFNSAASTVYAGYRSLSMEAGAFGGTVAINPISGPVDMSSGNTFYVWVYDTQGSNTLELRLTDTNGGTEAVYSSGPSTQNQWTRLSWNLSDFDVLDKSIIDHIELYEFNAGTYYFDGLGFDTQNDVEALSDYTWSVFNSTPAFTSTAANVHDGSRAVSMIAASGGGTIGLYPSASSRDISAVALFSVWVYDTQGSNTLELRLVDSSGNSKAAYSSNAAVKDQWTQLIWPLTYYSGSVNLAAIKSVQLYEYNAGTYYFDDIGSYTSSYTAAGTIDDMDTTSANSGWSGFGDSSVAVALRTVPGNSGNALQLDYNLNNGAWVVMSRSFYLNLLDGNQVKFWLKQTGGPDYVEVKLQDSDGTVFYKKRSYDVTGNWQEITIPYKDFTKFQDGEDMNLNLGAIQYVYFTVSKKDGTKGTVWIDDLSFEQAVAYSNNLGAGQIMASVAVNNNPFSPNGDGNKDTTAISFNLNDAATVRLRIYDLSGNVLYEQEQDFPAGANQYVWDGKDTDGKMQRSGLYIYQLHARNGDGREQNFKHIIGLTK
jgi:hypothetical protein